MKTFEELFPKNRMNRGEYYLQRGNPQKPESWFTISKVLEKEGKIDDSFLICLSQLSLEEVIALKMETSTRYHDRQETRIFGLPIWRSIEHIAKSAVLKWATSLCNADPHSDKEKRFTPTPFRILNMKKASYDYWMTLYGIDRYIEYFYQKHYLKYLGEKEQSLFYSFKKNKTIIKDLPKTDDENK